ncbi:MAG: hypothetical protein ACTSR2_14400 [Candidatus Hodarchaeales archaeon]
MELIKDVLSQRIKSKEKVDKITKIVIENPDKIKILISSFKQGTDTEKGTYTTALKQISANNPEIVEPYVDELIEYINHKSNRVKWGIPETIGNLAEKYPYRIEKAIPNLLLNTNDQSTGVRWCAAYAISRIILYNAERREELIDKINQIVREEKNNGVKNVYLKAIEQLRE